MCHAKLVVYHWSNTVLEPRRHRVCYFKAQSPGEVTTGIVLAFINAAKKYNTMWPDFQRYRAPVMR